MTEKFYTRPFHFPVSSSPFTLASDDVSYMYLSYLAALLRGTKYIFSGLRLYSRQIWWCAVVQNSDDAVLDLGSFFLWTVSNICV